MEPSSSSGLGQGSGAGGANLFWKSCPVLLRRGERGEERTTELTVRLISDGQKHGQRVLRIYISSESDLFLLHVLEVGEEEYALLRQEQDIRVDFANFAGKLIGLLDKCIACKEEDLPRFQAVLHAAAGQGSFKVVENNDFKQLPHITLNFRPGNDAAVKQFLAFRLSELRGDCSQLSAELDRTQTERNSLQNSLSEAKHALAVYKEQRERHLLEYQADVKAREAAVLESKARELADLREAGLRERAELDSKFREQLEAAQARISDLDTENRSLREHKFQLDSRVSELSHRLGAAEGSNKSLTEEVERLRALSTQLGREKAERDVELSEALARVSALEDKVAGQAGLSGEQAQRIRDMEASLRQVEARAEELKAAAQGHELRSQLASAELAKATTAIEKLENDLELQREKVRRKTAIITRQEEEMAARDKAADEAQQRARNLQRDLERANEDAGELRKEVAELRGKLEDSRTQVASNEQMIRWLNNQITEAQLHYSSGGVGLMASRYSYRPPAPVPPPASSGSISTGAGAVAPANAAAGGVFTARPAISTYRTPIVPTTAGSARASNAAQPPASAGTAAAPGSGGDSVPPRTTFRSSFYATHFGGGGGSGGSGEGPPAAGSGYTPGAAGGGVAGLTSAAARSLNLGVAATAQASQPAGNAGAAAAGQAAAPAAAAPSAARYLTSRFEMPTYRIADTAAGRVAVPVTSGIT